PPPQSTSLPYTPLFRSPLIKEPPSNIQYQVRQRHGLACETPAVLGFHLRHVLGFTLHYRHFTAFALPHPAPAGHRHAQRFAKRQDRKSTRLNSSHVKIS